MKKLVVEIVYNDQQFVQDALRETLEYMSEGASMQSVSCDTHGQHFHWIIRDSVEDEQEVKVEDEQEVKSE